VERAEGVDRGAHHRLDLRLVGDVRAQEEGAPPGRLDEPYGLGPAALVDVGHAHRGALEREAERGRATDPGTGAGHETHLPVEQAQARLPSRYSGPQSGKTMPLRGLEIGSPKRSVPSDPRS